MGYMGELGLLKENIGKNDKLFGEVITQHWQIQAGPMLRILTLEQVGEVGSLTKIHQVDRVRVIMSKLVDVEGGYGRMDKNNY
jgi:hypothetical protein